MNTFILPALAMLLAKVCIVESDKPVVISFLKPDGKTDDFTDTSSYDGNPDPKVESPNKDDRSYIGHVSIKPSDPSERSFTWKPVDADPQNVGRFQGVC
jgi:hypothetical protein